MLKHIEAALNIVMTVCFVAVLWTTLPSPSPLHRTGHRPNMALARFAVAYTRAREGTEYFSQCDPPPFRPGLQNERIEAQQRFAEMRKAAVGAGVEDVTELVDMEQQVLNEDARGYVQFGMVCQRLDHAGPTTLRDVMTLISAAEVAMR